MEQQVQLWSIPTLIERTQLSRATIYRLISSGDLKPIKIGNSTRFIASEVSAWIESRTQQARAA